MEKKMAAVRERGIAESLIKSKDYKGAREKLFKARNIFPGLEYIEGMIAVCHVLGVAADSAISGGGIEWYWVLQTDANANESQIHSKYQRLTTLLEPIKNTFPGTEDALTHIHNAFSALSNEKKRSVFDSERLTYRNPFAHCKLQEEKGATSQSSPGRRIAESETPDGGIKVKNSGGFSSKRPQDASKDQHVTVGRVGNSAISMKPNVSTGKGREQSVSTMTTTEGSGEMEIPVARWNIDLGGSCVKTTTLASGATGKRQPDYYDFENNRKTEIFAVGQIWAAYDKENMPRSYVRINSVGRSSFKLFVTWLKPAPSTLNEKNWCEVGLPVACGFFDAGGNSVAVAENTIFSHFISGVKGLKVEIYPKKGEVWAIYRDWKPFKWCSDPNARNGCGFLIVEILMGYSKDEGLIVAPLERVPGFTSIFRRCADNGSESSLKIPATHLLRFSHNVPAFRHTGKEKEKISNGMFELDPLAVPKNFVDCMPKPRDRESSKGCSDFTHQLHVSPPRVSDPEITSIKPKPRERESSRGCSDSTHQLRVSPPRVSDPEITSIKPKWSKEDFVSEHIWAIYDGPNSMPQRYVIVNNVVSQTEVCATFLDPYPIAVEDNIPFVCGLFRSGKTTLNFRMSLFSHLVFCERSTKKSFYRIFPRKGEIWAMYKNWNAQWKKSDYNGCQCQIVEILTDFSEASDIRIASLVEVPGFVTYFQRQLCNGFELVRKISRMEILSFSHQIPCFIVRRAAIDGVPVGALHLEPDALPLNLANLSV